MRRAIATLSTGLFASLLLVLGLGCGPKKPPANPGEQAQKANKKPGGPAKEVKSVKLPKEAALGQNVTLSGFYEDDMPGGDGQETDPDGKEAKGMAERPGGASVVGGPVKEVYRLVAPATVVVRSQRGYGSGIIYHPDGWILTNHHVVAHAWREDFRWKVKIALGRLSKSGVMERREKLYDAYVYKVDALLDLAVVKLVNPPKDLKAIAIAPKDPAPGEAVSALGHAGIGLAWAIKDGQISAVGKLSTHLTQLMLDAAESAKKQKEAAGTHDPRSERLHKLQKKRISEYRKMLETKKPALVIQSTCDISQGDSGGPLVNRQSELVGLNAFVRSGGLAKKESNFHIHVQEIRKFVKDVPEKTPQLLPDPWTDGGTLAKLGDADTDGTVDTLVMYQVRAYRVFFRVFRRQMAGAYFIDLDQNSFVGQPKLPGVKDIVDKKGFDAEFIYLAHGSQLHAWYDTNNDGKHDVLLVASAYNSKVTDGYRIDAAGKLQKDPSLKVGALVRPSLFQDSKLGERLQKAGSRFFTSRLLPRPRGQGRDYPDPVKAAGHEGQLRDYDRDGKPDTVQARGLWSRGYIVDVDQNTLGDFSLKDTLHKVRQSRAIDAEFSLIYHQNRAWAWYDTDNDGRFDLLLHGGYRPGYVVAEAWRVGADGKYTADPTQVGRLMVQPDLLNAKADTLRKITKRIVGWLGVATGPGVKSFPEPERYARYNVKVRDIGRLKGVAVEGRFGLCRTTLVDLDQDTLRRAKKEARKAEVEARKAARKLKKKYKATKKPLPGLDILARRGKFDAELALLSCYGSTWAFYDTRGKGSYDLVLYSSRYGKGKPTAAYVIDKKGNITARKKPIACDGMVHPRLFANGRLRRTMGKLGALFSPTPDGSCKP